MTFAASQHFEWPLRDPHAVEELIDAVDELEAALLAAGWAPLAPGPGWYAKRFSYGSLHDMPPTAKRLHQGRVRRRQIRLAPEPKRAP